MELSREAYELGDWAWAIEDAYEMGKEAKAKKRRDMVAGIDVDLREREGEMLAKDVVGWVDQWYDSEGPR